MIIEKLRGYLIVDEVIQQFVTVKLAVEFGVIFGDFLLMQMGCFVMGQGLILVEIML